MEKHVHASLNLDPIVTSALTRACNDCHSKLAVWPWYSRVAPVSWLVVSDVKRGRRALNFSDWKSLAMERQQELVPRDLQGSLEAGDAHAEHLLLHPQAKFSHVEVLSIARRHTPSASWVRRPLKTNDSERLKSHINRRFRYANAKH